MWQNSNCDKLKDFKYDKTQTQIVTKLKTKIVSKNSNSDETQIVIKFKNSNCDETQKLNWWRNSKTEIVTELQHSNFYKTQTVTTQVVTKLKLW